MTQFDFVSHDTYPEDPYIAESVVICIENKHRVTFLRKKMKNGGLFWDTISASVQIYGEKKYISGYEHESNFFKQDVLNFLNKRGWVKEGSGEKRDELPF